MPRSAGRSMLSPAQEPWRARCVSVLGAFQVYARRELANWHTGRPEDILAFGGAMDLAIGAKQVLAMMSRLSPLLRTAPS